MPTSPIPIEEDDVPTNEVIEKKSPPTDIQLNPITRQAMALPSPSERLLLTTTRLEKSPEEAIPPLPEALGMVSHKKIKN